MNTYAIRFRYGHEIRHAYHIKAHSEASALNEALAKLYLDTGMVGWLDSLTHTIEIFLVG
jgi:hypothetical protein